MNRSHTNERRQTGFTLIETMIAIVVLTFGLLSLAGVFAQGIIVANTTEMDYIAQKKAEEAMEAIFAARDSKTQPWANIQNVQGPSGNAGGIFLDLPQPLVAAGADGLFGTADEVLSSPEVVILGPGPDGKLGTADDVVLSLQGMNRTIAITDIPGESSLRQIAITMNYRVGHTQRQYTLLSYISQFS
jgi:prepilin-type N-terminal cleavage/methylation domain-containing protein